MDESDTEAFENHAVPPRAVPDYRDVEFEVVASPYRRYTLISTLASGLPVLLAPLAMHLLGNVPARVAGAAAVALAALSVVIAIHRWVGAAFRGWALRQHDLIARKGVLWRSVTALPIGRIQHVETTSGPLERLHGLARLKLFTAGGSTADLTVVGLTGETADRLREHLVEQIRLRDATETGTATAGPASGAARAGEHESD